MHNYDHVIVNDFDDGVTKSQDDLDILSEGKKFADIIARKIKFKGVFSKVERNVHSQNPGILIDGKITEYKEGNTLMRAMIGLGAGSSHFDAKVDIKDNVTKKTLGNINVNKMSWVLGGYIAASQDVRSHMDSAASKIANELVIAKGKVVDPAT